MGGSPRHFANTIKTKRERELSFPSPKSLRLVDDYHRAVTDFQFDTDFFYLGIHIDFGFGCFCFHFRGSACPCKLSLFTLQISGQLLTRQNFLQKNHTFFDFFALFFSRLNRKGRAVSDTPSQASSSSQFIITGRSTLYYQQVAKKFGSLAKKIAHLTAAQLKVLLTTKRCRLRGFFISRSSLSSSPKRGTTCRGCRCSRCTCHSQSS